MAKPKPIKVCLTNQGRDTETPWAEDLGPARGPSGSRIAVDGGRWAMIVDYALHPDAGDADATFDALATACAEQEVVCEGAWGPREGKPGRAYLAVKNELSDAALMTALRSAELPCELIQIHPEPPKPKRVTKRAATKPATRAAKLTTKAAAKKPASKKPPAKKPAAKRR